MGVRAPPIAILHSMRMGVVDNSTVRQLLGPHHPDKAATYSSHVAESSISPSPSLTFANLSDTTAFKSVVQSLDGLPHGTSTLTTSEDVASAWLQLRDMVAECSSKPFTPADSAACPHMRQ